MYIPVSSHPMGLLVMGAEPSEADTTLTLSEAEELVSVSGLLVWGWLVGVGCECEGVVTGEEEGEEEEGGGLRQL